MVRRKMYQQIQSLKKQGLGKLAIGRELKIDPDQAMLDRLLHHANIFTLTGESYRLLNKKEEKAV